MGFGIIVQINGANLQSVYRGFGEGRVSQHIHFIFETLAGELAHMGKQIPGNSPETGLGIGHGYAVQKSEQGAGQKIAETAAEGNVILMEIAAGESAPPSGEAPPFPDPSAGYPLPDAGRRSRR